MGHVTGADKVLKNMKGFQRQFVAGLIESVEQVAIIIADFIRVTYQRPITGKGFTDRTSLLRQSISHKVTVERGLVIGWIFASGGGGGKDDEAYAHHVEFISGGKFAFMLPGFLAKKPEIMKLLIKELKRRGLAA